MHPRLLLAVRVGAAAALASAVPGQYFQQVAGPLGITGIATNPTYIGNGVCVADFDGDGDVDVILTEGPGAPFCMFRNDGGFVFTDVSSASGLGNSNNAICLQAADIDNDGDDDLYVGNDGAAGQLFVNDGTGHFTEQGALRGLTHLTQNYAATFGDFDRDGWLDLYLGNRVDWFGQAEANTLYRNIGNGFFTDVTASAGVGGTGATLVAVFFDYDEDGWPDLFEGNDKGNTYGPNEVYRNLGDGTFQPVAAQIGAAITIDCMGMDFVDVFHDGGVDFYCSDLPYDHLFQHWHEGTGTYADDTYTYGLAGGGLGWAVNWLDYDNDGWQDLHVVQLNSPNLLFHNPGQPAASPVLWPDEAVNVGLAQAYRQYVAAVADFDDDGRLDLLQRYHFSSGATLAPAGVALHRNTGATGNWLKFRPRGTASNRDGLGARVEVDAGGLHQRQWVRSGVGYLSTSDRRLHFGLGTATTAGLVTVTWPSGQVQYLTDVAANQIVDLVEPSLQLQAPATVGGTTSLELSIPGDEGLIYLLPLAFATNPPLLLPDGRVVPIHPDDLTTLSLSFGNAILPNGLGVLDASGAGSSPLIIPPWPALSGFTLYGTATTLDFQHFPLLRTVFPQALTITIQ